MRNHNLTHGQPKYRKPAHLGFLTLLSCLTIMALNPAQAQFSINTEIRPRAEYRDGYKSLSTENSTAAIFVSQRSRLTLNFQQDRLRSSFSIQDVRVWGDETLYSSTGMTGDNASIDVHEAWLQLDFLKCSSVKIGRQELKYDDQRLLAARNWNQNSVTYDAFLYRLQRPDWLLDLVFSLNNDKENTFGNAYNSGKMKTLNFVYLQKKIRPELTLSAIALGTGFTPDNRSEIIYMRGTYGATLRYNRKNMSMSGAGYYQNGKNRSGQPVSAYFFSMDFMQKMDPFVLGGGLNYLSGQDGLRSDADYQNTDHLFDILYGTRHTFFGSMDYFSNVPASTRNGGLIDLFLNSEYKFGKHKVCLDYHLFSLQNQVLDPTYEGSRVKTLDMVLGSEFDSSLDLTLMKGVLLQIGYSVMFPSESLEIIGGLTPGESDFCHWGWAMLTFKQTLFDSSKK